MGHEVGVVVDNGTRCNGGDKLARVRNSDDAPFSSSDNHPIWDAGFKKEGAPWSMTLFSIAVIERWVVYNILHVDHEEPFPTHLPRQ